MGAVESVNIIICLSGDRMNKITYVLFCYTGGSSVIVAASDDPEKLIARAANYCHLQPGDLRKAFKAKKNDMGWVSDQVATFYTFDIAKVEVL